ncbi:DNA polymerase IV [Clostridium sp. DL1XJH146]
MGINNNRRIIHVDMDAFFAAVEQHDNPKLKGRPVIVGGTSNRGVVSTCSYEARKFGVHSAMPIFMAKSKCPNGVYVPVRYGRYKEVSRQVFEILYRVTDRVEPLSIDEAYLDVTDVKLESIKIANWIKREVLRNTGLTISAGISYNKFLAKIASDWNKPNGIKEINQDMIPEILKPLSIDKIYGLGKKSVQKLNNIGIYKVEELLKLEEDFFVEYFGKYGNEIYWRIRGIDNRNVKVERNIKSIGRESTLKEDTKDKENLKEYLKDFSSNIEKSLYARNLYCKTITVKYKTASFQGHTKSKTVIENISGKKEIYKVATEILEELYIEEEIRLIGLSVTNLYEKTIEQISFL